MGLVISLILICVLTTALCYFNSSDRDRIGNALAGLITSFCISTALMLIIWAASYGNFLGMQRRLATVEQYGSAVEIYAEKGVAEFKRGNGGVSEFTDLKYQNYQGQIGKMIIDLRRHVKEYNENLVTKRLLKKNWFFSWCVIMPDNGKIIKMKDYLN